MDAKLVRVIEAKPGRSWYFREYEYECIRCGEHFFRHTCNDRINPYCAKCFRENERIKARAKRVAQKKQIEVDILEKVKKDIYHMRDTDCLMKYVDPYTVADVCIEIVNKYIEEGVVYGKRN